MQGSWQLSPEGQKQLPFQHGGGSSSSQPKAESVMAAIAAHKLAIFDTGTVTAKITLGTAGQRRTLRGVSRDPPDRARVPGSRAAVVRSGRAGRDPARCDVHRARRSGSRDRRSAAGDR
jgi:hypothetical protein